MSQWHYNKDFGFHTESAMETNPVSLIPSSTPSLFPVNQSIPQHCLQCLFKHGCVRTGHTQFNYSIYCDSPLFALCSLAQRMPWLSCGRVFFKCQNIDTRWLLDSFSHWRWCGLSPSFCHQPMSAYLFFCLSLCPPPFYLVVPPPLCYLCCFLLHSAIQTMSGTMALRINATGFSRSQRMCRCLTEATSKIHCGRGKKSGKQTHQLSTASALCETATGWVH